MRTSHRVRKAHALDASWMADETPTVDTPADPRTVADTLAAPVRPRRLYRRLIVLPAFGLYDDDDRLVATIRAENAYVARELFHAYGLEGARVRLVAKAGER